MSFTGALRRSLARVVGRPSADLQQTPKELSGQRAEDTLETSYAPEIDDQPDPGEVVWTWVAYEDDPSDGKDRPVLIIGHRGQSLVGLMLTSKDHDRDAEQERRYGRYWMDVGSGGWDHEGRPSEVRLDRLITVDASQVRREGAALDQDIFDAVFEASKQFR